MSSLSSTPTATPIWAVQLALQAILISVQQFSDAHLRWAALSSNTLHGIPSFGLGLDDVRHASGSAIQPTREQAEALRIPVQGEAWDEYKEALGRNAEAVKGLRSFKTTVAREKEHLDKLVASSSPSDPCPTSSNGPFLCQLWQQVLRVALTHGPVMEVNASLPIPAEGQLPSAASNSARQRRLKVKGGGKSRLAKVDVIADGGRSWTRMFTIKKSSLLAEFREAESYMGAAGSSSDEDDVGEGEGELSGSGISEGRAKRLGASQSLFAQLDQATANCSVVRNLEELLACRAASKHHDAITLDLIFSRIELPAPKADHSSNLTLDYLTSSSEEERYLSRLQSIANLVARLPKATVKTHEGILAAPPGKLLPSLLASGLHSHPIPADLADFDTSLLSLPAVPTPPAEEKLSSLPCTHDLNLDVSALVALVSDISHMALPEDEVDLESLFHTMGIKSIEAQRGEEEESEEASDSRKDAKARFLHGRALAMQLALEKKGLSFLSYVFQLSKSSGGRPLRFFTTSEAKEKFCEIMRLVAGPDEQRRANALLGGDGREGADLSKAFWQGSRWKAVQDSGSAFALPINVISVEGSPALAPRDLPPFAARCRQVIVNGLSDLSDKTHSSSTSANPRQTAHTLNTLLLGIDRGMTTLTTNMLSVRWLVKEVARRMGDSHIRGEKVFNGQYESALIVVTNPRSLAEKMKVEPGQAMDHPLSEKGSQEQDHIVVAPAVFSSTDTSSHAMPSRNRSYPSSDSSKGVDSKQWSSGEGEHIHDTLPHLPTVFSPRYNIEETNGEDGGSYGHGRDRGSAVAPRSRFRRLVGWAAGPSPPVQLRIRHYPWWPFQRVEEGWIKLTRSVAWRDPDEDKEAVRRELEDRDRPLTWPRRPAWLQRGHSQTMDLEDLSPPSSQRHAERQADYPRRVAPPLHPATAWKMHFVKEWRTNKIHWLLLFLTCVAWLAGFIALANDLWFNASVRTAGGEESTAPSFYSCTSTYWLQNTQCGLNGQDCEPFYQNTSIAFRCPASCAGTVLGAGRAVGSEVPQWVPLIVGGGDDRGMYRGDSWVCAAAIHAGLFTSDTGGCGQMWLAGSYADYIGSTANGLTSEGFNSSFPISYFFEEQTTSSHCTDTRERIYILDTVLSTFTGLVLQPAALVWFYIIICVGFWHLNFASEPRAFPPTVGDPAGDFLPLLFACYVVYRITFRFSFPAFARFPIERTIGTLALFWIGVMLDVVFANVPLQRLVLSDITSQPGALTSLIVIIIVVVVVAINQVRVVRKTGYLPKYLTLAIVGGIIIGLLAAVPTTGLRLHHYIIALVLLPFLAFETRISLLAAWFLLGMLINGIGRWGWDGLIQDISTITGDSTTGSALPSFLPATNWTGVQNGSGLVHWTSLADAAAEGDDVSGYTGFSLMIDDVLRLSGSGETYFDLATLWDDYDVQSPLNNFTYYPAADVREAVASQPHYLRLAYTSEGDAADFTRAAVAYFNGTWIDAPSGAT